MTACESSPNKQSIDRWLNEDKSCNWISDKLKELNDPISVVSISKYKKLRDDWIQKEIEKSPTYQAKSKEVQDQFNTGIGMIKKVDVLANLSQVIEDTSSYLADAKSNSEVKIRSMKDYQLVSSTLLDAVKLYGDTMLKAQRMGEINKDPTLLKPTTININVKSALTDILSNAMNTGGYELIDKLRGGTVSANINQDTPTPTPDAIETEGSDK